MRKILATIGATLAIVGVMGASAGPASADGWTTDGRWADSYDKSVG
jgi:hypothetical protein